MQWKFTHPSGVRNLVADFAHTQKARSEIGTPRRNQVGLCGCIHETSYTFCFTSSTAKNPILSRFAASNLVKGVSTNFSWENGMRSIRHSE